MSSAASSSLEADVKKLVILKSAEGETFQVEKAVLKSSDTLRTMLDDKEGGQMIPLPKVNSRILAIVIDYCKKLFEASSVDASDKAKKDLKEYLDTGFIDNEPTLLLPILMAAKYLEIQNLFDAACNKFKALIEGKGT